MNAVIKTTRLFNFPHIQVTLLCLSAVPVEVKYCTASLRTHAGVSFWSFLCCFCIYCHILQCFWW